MELTRHGFLEELLAPPRRDTWGSFSDGLSEYFPSGWSFDSLDDNPSLDPAASSDNNNPSSSSFVGFSSAPTEPSFECPPLSIIDNQHQAYHHSSVDGFTVPPEIDSSSYTNNIYMPSLFPTMVEEEDDDQLGLLSNQSLEDRQSCCVEVVHATTTTNNNNIQGSNISLCGDNKKRKNKKLEGQPSKNLMAERRRRKRLNDRLSMLRSIVPKISKMDRTSILGDTIDYMKELLERINKLQEEETELNSNQLLLGNFTELDSTESLVRNSPKFDVERREDIDTRINVSCASKPGLLLSTVGTLEALGLEIQQCVISCFNDFSFQASCSEATKQRTLLSSEEVKEALFRNAGYGGR